MIRFRFQVTIKSIGWDNVICSKVTAEPGGNFTGAVELRLKSESATEFGNELKKAVHFSKTQHGYPVLEVSSPRFVEVNHGSASCTSSSAPKMHVSKCDNERWAGIAHLSLFRSLFD